MRDKHLPLDRLWETFANMHIWQKIGCRVHVQLSKLSSPQDDPFALHSLCLASGKEQAISGDRWRGRVLNDGSENHLQEGCCQGAGTGRSHTVPWQRSLPLAVIARPLLEHSIGSLYRRAEVSPTESWARAPFLPLEVSLESPRCRRGCLLCQLSWLICSPGDCHSLTNGPPWFLVSSCCSAPAPMSEWVPILSLLRWVMASGPETAEKQMHKSVLVPREAEIWAAVSPPPWPGALTRLSAKLPNSPFLLIKPSISSS